MLVSETESARIDMWRDYENATNRLERSSAANTILVSLGVEDATIEDVAKVMRWADAYAGNAIDSLVAKGWRKNV